MQRIYHKKLALYPGGQLLQDQYFRDIRERIFNEDRHTQKEDTGAEKYKKNVLSPTGFGSNDREHNPGAGMGLGREPWDYREKGVGSGYNDGGPADDETGPGYTSSTPDPYSPQIVLNGLFMGHYLRKSDRDTIQRNINSLKSKKTVKPSRKFDFERE